MQFLKLDKSTTLSDLADMVGGSRNVEEILRYNGLTRCQDIGKAYDTMCNDIVKYSDIVNSQRKASLLNTFTGDEYAFELAALASERDWKIISALNTLPGYIRIPDTLTIKDTVKTIGSSGIGVTTTIYKSTMESLKQNNEVDPAIFNSYSVKPVTNSAEANSIQTAPTSLFEAFKLPWGKIQLYSSLSGEIMDFPVYPEELGDKRQANYTTMPDTIYQYEPWYMYESSGPRQMNYKFHIHRDMWTGDHTDGKANQLIRFCEANCYPDYNGSLVNVSTVKLYINGKKHISGIMTEVGTDWSGPIGQDGFYLECNLSLSITEVAEEALTYSKVKSMSLIGV